MSDITHLTIEVDTSRCKRRIALLEHLPRWALALVPFDLALWWVKRGARFSVGGKCV